MQLEHVTTTSIVDLIYPIGSIYMSVNSVSPQTLFAGTYWEAIEGKFLLAADESHAGGTDGGTATQTLSQANLPSHSHTYTPNGTIAQESAHTHNNNAAFGFRVGAYTISRGENPLIVDTSASTNPATVTAGTATQYKLASTSSATAKTNAQDNQYSVAARTTSSGTAHTHTFTGTQGTTNTTGDTESFSIMPPYLSVYMWKRVEAPITE